MREQERRVVPAHRRADDASSDASPPNQRVHGGARGRRPAESSAHLAVLPESVAARACH
jgi:hypothetical protein